MFQKILKNKKCLKLLEKDYKMILIMKIINHYNLYKYQNNQNNKVNNRWNYYKKKFQVYKHNLKIHKRILKIKNY